jgi:hypothetical protein
VSESAVIGSQKRGSNCLALSLHFAIGAAVRDDPTAAAGPPRLDEAEIVAIFIAF